MRTVFPVNLLRGFLAFISEVFLLPFRMDFVTH